MSLGQAGSRLYWYKEIGRYVSGPRRVEYSANRGQAFALEHYSRVSSVVSGLKQRIANDRSFDRKVEAIVKRKKGSSRCLTHIGHRVSIRYASGP